MSEDVVPVFAPAIGEDTLKAVADAFEMGWLGMGATTRAFEDAIGAFVGADRPVVATNTGTSALHVAVAAAGIGPGDEVIVPSFTFVADHQAILAEGADPVFCDIREADLGIDPDAIEALISAKTKAIMPLHFAGVPCAIERVYEIARRSGLRVIEDATHAFGSAHPAGGNIGASGDIACFSFDPVKVITSIDGGAVILPAPEEAERARHFRLLGIDRDTEARYRNERAWDYDVVCKGARYHMTNVNASIGLSQLARAAGFIASRQDSCRRYTGALQGIAEIATPATDFAGVSPFIYTVRVLDGSRGDLIAALRDRGIATGIHFMPAHRYSRFVGCRSGDLSVTELAGSQILTLPLHSGMMPATVDRVAGAIRSFYGV